MTEIVGRRTLLLASDTGSVITVKCPGHIGFHKFPVAICSSMNQDTIEFAYLLLYGN